MTCNWCGTDIPADNARYCSKRHADLGRARDAQNRRDALAEEVEHLLGFGIPARRVAEQLGHNAQSLTRALERGGHPKLAIVFERLRRDERRHECADCGEWGVNAAHARCFRCACVAREARKRVAS